MSKQLTKDDIRTIIKMWESQSVRQIAETLGVAQFTIYSVAKELRANGLHVPAKRRKNVLHGLVKEVVNEMNTPLPS